MIPRSKIQKMLCFEAIGFLSLISLSWLDELAQLPHWLFDSPAISSWPEALLETAALLAVWLMFYLLTKRCAGCERSVQVCIWCRKVSDGRGWFPTEDYLSKSLEITPSQCACPTCSKKWAAYPASRTA